MPRVLGIEVDTDFRAALAAIPGNPGLALIGMMFIDAAFILVSADQDFREARNSLHVSVDNGIAEHWQYIKWGALALMLGFVAWVKRALIYVIWAVLFAYLLIDDSQQIHEIYGLTIADALGFQPAFGLRPQDFGELIVTALAAGPLLVAIGLVYLFASRSDERVFTHTMIALLIALALFGVGVDMLDIMVPWPWLATTLGIVEDGGEMIVATVMVAYVTGFMIRSRRPAPDDYSVDEADDRWVDDETPPFNARYSPTRRHPPGVGRR